jgi:hypothetical protein
LSDLDFAARLSLHVVSPIPRSPSIRKNDTQPRSRAFLAVRVVMRSRRDSRASTAAVGFEHEQINTAMDGDTSSVLPHLSQVICIVMIYVTSNLYLKLLDLKGK